MSRRIKISIAAIVMVMAVSLLFLVVENTPSFRISYGFAMLAIVSVAVTFCLFDKHKVVQSYGFLAVVSGYALVSILFSIVAMLLSVNPIIMWFFHLGMVSLTVIVMLGLSIVGGYIVKREEEAKHKHEAFQAVKKDYW